MKTPGPIQPDRMHNEHIAAVDDHSAAPGRFVVCQSAARKLPERLEAAAGSEPCIELR